MKLNDSDLISTYNATKRLGNPATAAAGDSKQLRQNMHDTTHSTSMIPDELKETVMQLTSIELKEKAIKQLFDDIADSLACAEDLLTEKEIVEGLLSAIEDQRLYYKQKENFYNNLKTTLRFALNENYKN